MKDSSKNSPAEYGSYHDFKPQAAGDQASDSN